MSQSDLTRVEAIMPAVRKVAGYNHQRYNLPKTIAELEKEIAEKKDKAKPRTKKDDIKEYLIVGGIVAAAIGFFAREIAIDLFEMTMLQHVLASLCLGGIVSIFFVRSFREDREEAAEKLPKLEQRYVSCLKEREEFQKNYPVEYPGLVAQIKEVIPEDYASPSVIYKLHEYLRNQRADTLKEAINLYELEQHQQRVEETQKAIEEETYANGQKLDELKQRVVNLENAPVQRY